MKLTVAAPDWPTMAVQWKAEHASVAIFNYLYGQFRIIVSGRYEYSPRKLEPVIPQFCTYDQATALGIAAELVTALLDLPELADPREVEACALAVAERHGGHDGGRVRLDQAKEPTRPFESSTLAGHPKEAP